MTPTLTARRPALRLWHVVLFAAIARGTQAAEVAGFTEPSRDISVSSADTGRIETVDVQEGTVVSAGDLLARTSPAILEASRRIADQQIAASGRLRSAKAELQHQTARLEKLEALLARDHAGQEEVDRARIDREVAAAALQTAEEELLIRRLERDRIDRQIERTEVRSPIDGVVVKVHKDTGEFVSPADPVVARVVKLNPLTAVFAVPERMAAEVSVAGAASVRFDRGGRTVEGRVQFVSPVVEPQSGTVRVKVTLDNADGSLRAGEKCSLFVDYAEQMAAAEEDTSN